MTKKLRVAFDCDGTLTHSYASAVMAGDGNLVDMPREDVVQLLKQFAEHGGFEVIVHTGNGQRFAENLVRRLGLEEYVDRCASKWDADVKNRYDIVVDDLDAEYLGKIVVKV